MSSSSPAQAPNAPPKISSLSFYVASGFLLGAAVVVAVARVFARIRKEHRLYFDDAFFFLATICLIAGSTLAFIDIPYIYLQEDVDAGLQKPPANLLTQLINSERIQDAGTVLLTTTLFSVKFSFLFFFRHLLQHQKKLMLYWWFVCFITVPSAPVCMFSDFIACSYFDERIVVQCTSAEAFARQTAILEASAILDILTDCFLISIPVLLLWNVRINIRRKLILGSILCLSIFMVLIAIVRVSTGKSSNGQVDSAWVIFWLQAEACVAVIVVSVSAFRALFMAQQETKYRHQRSPWKTSGGSQVKLWTANIRNKKSLPSAPSPTHAGVRTQINHSLDDRSYDPATGGIELPLQGTGILVTHDMSSAAESASQRGGRPSADSFV
ncbi:hypothetical protein MMC11_007853 [Xylographa trunciseda]|nr:hypothetical protein [Xylographa trunciseda]